MISLEAYWRDHHDDELMDQRNFEISFVNDADRVLKEEVFYFCFSTDFLHRVHDRIDRREKLRHRIYDMVMEDQ